MQIVRLSSERARQAVRQDCSFCLIAIARRAAGAARPGLPEVVARGSHADAQAVLDAGTDKVSVNSAAVARAELIDELAERFGAQCVVLAIDAKRDGAGGEVFVAGARTATGRDAVAWARQGVERGAGEILPAWTATARTTATTSS